MPGALRLHALTINGQYTNGTLRLHALSISGAYSVGATTTVEPAAVAASSVVATPTAPSTAGHLRVHALSVAGAYHRGISVTVTPDAVVVTVVVDPFSDRTITPGIASGFSVAEGTEADIDNTNPGVVVDSTRAPAAVVATVVIPRPTIADSNAVVTPDAVFAATVIGIVGLATGRRRFQPPSRGRISPTAHDASRIANRLASFFAQPEQGVNVYLLVDGTVTENQPDDYETVSKVFHGGHVNEITVAEAATLTTAGCGPYIEAG